jgi:hypothetical protein
MTVFKASPRTSYRPGRVSRSQAIVDAIEWAELGTLYAVELSDLQGNTPEAKQRNTVRQVSQYFKPIQTLIEDNRLYIRRLPRTATRGA